MLDDDWLHIPKNKDQGDNDEEETDNDNLEGLDRDYMATTDPERTDCNSEVSWLSEFKAYVGQWINRLRKIQKN